MFFYLSIRAIFRVCVQRSFVLVSHPFEALNSWCNVFAFWCDAARKLWRDYFASGVDGVVFIVDAVDRARFPEAKKELDVSTHSYRHTPCQTTQLLTSPAHSLRRRCCCRTSWRTCPSWCWGTRSTWARRPRRRTCGTSWASTRPTERRCVALRGCLMGFVDHWKRIGAVLSMSHLHTRECAVVSAGCFISDSSFPCLAGERREVAVDPPY